MKKAEAIALRVSLIIIAFLVSALGAVICYALYTEGKNFEGIRRFFGASYIGNMWVKLFFCMSGLLAIALLIYAIAFVAAYYKERNASLLKQEDKKETVFRFESLREIDKRMAAYRAPEYDDTLSLEEICERFRNFCASKYGLYYDILTIRSFIASLLITKLIIMQGISGTGKTSLAWAFGEFVGKPSSIIPVQPSWKEKTDLLGYFNEFTDRFNETEFLRKLYEARYTDDVGIMVLDEMNIARVEYYFAEFLSLLEMKQADRRTVSLTASGWFTDPKLMDEGRFTLPENVWYVGTANNDDSTMAISDKVYDRAMVLDLDRRAEPFEAPLTEGIRLSCSHLSKLGEEALAQYTISDKAVSGIDALDRFLTEHFGIAFGNRTMRQIENFVPVYLAAGGTEDEAVDIIVSRKVLRKLESKNPMTIKKHVQDFYRFLDSVFGESKLPLCRRVIEKYNL